MRVKDAVGKYGEQRAVEYLQERGHEIVARNWRCSEGELDIVAQEGDVLVFCEVKTRSGLAFGDPAEAVTADKIQRIRRLALRWLATNQRLGKVRDLRFDVIAVVRMRDRVTVRHLRGAL
jgi:putative endonuclease